MDKLVVQLNIAADTDFEQLLSVEGALIEALLPDHAGNVAGHTIGQGRFNISINIKGWEPALTRVTSTLDKLQVLHKAIVAKFHGGTQKYEVVRPSSYVGTFAL